MMRGRTCRRWTLLVALLLMAAGSTTNAFTALHRYPLLRPTTLNLRAAEKEEPRDNNHHDDPMQPSDLETDSNTLPPPPPSSSSSSFSLLPRRRRPHSLWRQRLQRRVTTTLSPRKHVTPVLLGILSSSAFLNLERPTVPNFRPRAAFAASAPVMAPPRRDVIDPETEAMFDVTKRIQQKNEQEMLDFQRRARQIAETEGEQARVKFEQEWEAERRQKAEEKAKGLEELKRNLLDEGICPFVDMEGRRQVLKYEKGVDLAEVPGTRYYMERDFEKNQFKRSMKYQKQAHRFIIKSMVEDMKKRNIDPLEYFEKNQEKTSDILNMSTQKAILLADQYKENLAKYGQLTKPKPGEELPLAKTEDPEEAAAKAKAQAKEEKERAKAEAKAEKERQRAEAKAEKERQREEARKQKEAAKAEKQRLKEEARKEKEAAKKAKEDAKAAAAAAAAAGATAAASSVAAGVSMAAEAAGTAAADSVGSAIGPGVEESTVVTEEIAEGVEKESVVGEGSASAATESVKTGSKAAKAGFSFVPAAATVVVAGGGAFAIKVQREKSARDEEERQRQFKLLMGETYKDEKVDGDKNDPIDSIDVELGDESVLGVEHSALEDSTSEDEDDKGTELQEAPKKKKRGIRSMFGKRNANQRETDLSALISEDAEAPDFALLLAKILTYGAPGRFPRVEGLPGGMPMQEFDLETGKDLLSKALVEDNISNVEGAEVFANVVNCMLIDIVDLASSSLKEDDKVTVDAINIVVDFMNHAASLYDAIAEGVVITPVTYGGTLQKGKLEQMYSIYTMSGIMTMDENFNSRVGLLQDVFGISEKRAEGLMTKAVQKNMWKMMKDGEGMEGMDEMMKAMGGAEGLEGLAGLGGEDGPSPEQLKEMLTTLKTMKDSGTIPPDELDAVRSQFKEAFGSSIEDVMKDADSEKDSLGETDKELLDLMKSILDD